jgi:hypothetical protein
MEVPDPVRDAQDRFAAMAVGTFDRVTPDEAAAGLDEATEWLNGEIGRRKLGSGVIKEMPLYEGGDWLPVWVAITDGDRNGAVLVTLNGSAAAAGLNAGEDPVAHVLERVRRMGMQNDYSHFDQLALAHPLRL